MGFNGMISLIFFLQGIDKKDDTANMTETELEMLLVSNALLMMFAGLDTSSTGLSSTLYFLSKNPEAQERLHEEVLEVLEQNDSGEKDVTYDDLQSLSFLEMCIMESLRRFPVTMIERKCTKDYQIPGTNVTIEKGTLVQVPNTGIMKNPEYFEDPEKFCPENFSPDAKAERGALPFMVFGHGPRNCIGMRFALVQMKICLARIIAEYKVLPSDKMPDKWKIDPLTMIPESGFWVKLEKRS